MRSSVCNGRSTASAVLCLALLSPVVPAGNAFAQPGGPEHQWQGYSVANGPEIHAPGTASRPAPTDDKVGDVSARPPGAIGEKPGDSKCAEATGLERGLGTVSESGRSEGNDVLFLVLAVALYLACPLIADHLKAAVRADGGERPSPDESMITFEEVGTDHDRKPAQRVESAEVGEPMNRDARCQATPPGAAGFQRGCRLRTNWSVALAQEYSAA